MWSSWTTRWAVIWQRDDPGSQPDGVGQLTGGGQEHLRRSDHLPAAGVVLAAPELVIAETVEMCRQLKIALELQRRVLAERMVGCEERAELETR
jgi:hypothetical protein